MKRVYCLYRASTLKQVEKKSNNPKDLRDDIPMQKKMCYEFAQQQNDWQIIKEFLELGVSGSKVSANDRDAILEIKKAAIEKRFDVLLCFMFDRIGRIDSETPFVVEWFIQNGIEVWSTYEGQQRLDNHTDKLVNYMRFWDAAGESIKISKRTKAGIKTMIGEGKWPGGPPPIGYRLNAGRINKRGIEVSDIEVHPDEVEIARAIFDKYVFEGLGRNRMANFIKESGIKIRSFRLDCMLRDPLYIGIIRRSGTRSEPQPHLQIIDNEIFEKAQVIMEQRSNKSKELRSLPMQTKGKTLLTGNVFCGHCGGPLTKTTNGNGYVRKDGTKNPNKRVKYNCYNKSRKVKPCDGQTGYTAHILDDVIVSLLMDLFENIKDAPEDDVIEKRYQSELSIIKNKIKTAKAELKKLIDNLKTYQDEVIKAIQGTSKFDSDVLNDLIKQTKEGITNAENIVSSSELELENQQQHIEEIKSKYQDMVCWADMFEDSNLETKKMITAYLLESVMVRRGYEIEIKFSVGYEHFCKVGGSEGEGVRVV